MTETWPPEAYVRLCIENAELLREEWEKRGWQFGDWAYPKNLAQQKYHRLTGAGIVTGLYDAPFEYRVEFDSGTVYMKRDDLIPLPQPRQLIAMLEERGIEWHLSSPTPFRDCYECMIFGKTGESRWNKSLKAPDPASALLLAWVEVVSQREPVGKGGEESATFP